MKSEERAWTNEGILQEVLTQILRDIYKIASSPETRVNLREALEDESIIRFRDRLVSLQIGPLLDLMRFLDGAIGPLDWPGLKLVNAETGETLSQDLQWSFSVAESTVIDEVEPPMAQDE